jgi:hypothetical protein
MAPTRTQNDNRRWAWLVALTMISFLSGAVVPYAFHADDAHGAGYVSIAMLAGVGGNVSTLACYDPDPYTAHPIYAGKPNPWPTCRTTDDSPPDTVTGNHSGLTAPTDIANGGSTVYVQNDYLPSAVRGGYLYPEDATTGCYDPSTSGGRTKV